MVYMTSYYLIFLKDALTLALCISLNVLNLNYDYNKY